MAGVKSVTIYDPEPVVVQDLSSQVSLDVSTSEDWSYHMLQFFLREEDVGRARGEATVGRLAELNAYVPVRNLPGRPGQEISVDLIKGFQVTIIQIWYYGSEIYAGRCSVRCPLQ